MSTLGGSRVCPQKYICNYFMDLSEYFRTTKSGMEFAIIVNVLLHEFSQTVGRP